MERILFVLVIVLVSSIGGGCYKINGTKIENCVTTACNDIIDSSDMEYQLDCTGCGGDPYPSIQFLYNFTINCENETSEIASGISYILPLCMDNVFIHEDMLIPGAMEYFTFQNITFGDANLQEGMKACNNETILKLLAAIARCNINLSICENCPFKFDGERCNVTYDVNSFEHYSIPSSIPTASTPTSTSSSTTSSSMPTSSIPTSTNYYEIDGTVIVNNSPDSVISAPQKYQLNCPNCTETGETGDYVTLIYRHPFVINCPSGSNNEADSNTFERSLIKIPSCSSSSLAILLKELTADNTATPTDYSDMSKQNYSCDDETVVIKLIAATLVCNGLRNITQECKFVLNHTQICKVIYQNMSTTTTTTDSLITQIAFFITPISVILALIILAILIVVTVIVCYRLRSRHDDNSGKEVYACIDESSASFQMTTRGVNVTNIEVNNNSNITTDAMYADIIENNMGGRIRSNSKDSQDSQDIQPSDPVLSADPVVLQANVSYTKFVEGEVADTKLYQELPYIKNQSAYSVASNPLYNFSPAKPFIEPSSSLPELESAFKCGLYQIETGALELGEMFASGQFGVVYRGIYKTEKGDIPVAVKALKDSVSKDTLAAFIREAAIMAQFSHPNVLRLLGVKTTEQPWMIVTELLKTELRELLLKIRNEQSLTNVLRRVLMKFTVEIADGMEYLAMRNFVHRDLAARNVLVAKDLTIRIADFGMTREVGSENSYYTSSGGIVPLRWTAPEAVFFQKYSEKSDVWSYGMTLFEIWTLGDKPWGSATNEKIIETLSTMTCISPPPDCPETVERIMLETWRHEKVDRPTFTGVRAMLSSLTL